MLEQVDLSKSISKKEYEAVLDPLRWRLSALQEQAKDAGVCTVIVFEGWDAAGKGTLINRLATALDPRGFKVHPISAPTEEEALRPFLWRFWTRLPAKGQIGIFDRSWYGDVLIGRVEKLIPRKRWQRSYEEILEFERQLADDGVILIKFWLHIDKREQKKRFKKLERDPALSWKVGKGEWRRHRQYDKYLLAVEEMLERTNTAFAPWTVVEATDRRFARVKMYETVIAGLERALARPSRSATAAGPSVPQAIGPVAVQTGMLDHADLTKTLGQAEYTKRLDDLQEELFRLEHEIYTYRIPVVIAYEGWDAAGKGGNIKRLTLGLDPRGYEVIPVGAPTDDEKAHHYLWRFWRHLPKAGHIVIFDRTWYGRVLVERVEGFCAREDWERAYREINEFEGQLVSFGTVLIKFWLHISKEEQLRRFQERETVEHKKYKITPEDWRNREKWDLYKAAITDMLQRTSTTYAPWTIVEANSKYYGRIKALSTVLSAMQGAIREARKRG